MWWDLSCEWVSPGQFSIPEVIYDPWRIYQICGIVEWLMLRHIFLETSLGYHQVLLTVQTFVSFWQKFYTKDFIIMSPYNDGEFSTGIEFS